MNERVRCLLLSAVLVVLSLGGVRAQTHRSAVGVAEVSLGGAAVNFLPTLAGGSYASAAGDQITVFKPEGAGRVAALSVEWMAVHPSAVFEVYAGTKPEGTALFSGSGKREWEYFQGDPAKDGGALTVRFNANGKAFIPGTDGRAGWQATALSVKPDMTDVAAWKLNGARPSKLLLRQENDSIFMSQILVTGEAGVLQSVKLALGEDGVNVTKIKLNGSFGSVEGAVTGRFIEFDMQSGRALPLGWNAVSMVTTVQEVAAGVERVSLIPVALKLSDREISERRFPGGASYEVDRETLPQIVLDKKFDEQASCKVDLPFSFVPSLDAKGKYETGEENLAVILEPADGKVAQIDFKEFELDGNAQVRIFYGADTLNLCASYGKNDAGVAKESPVVGRRDLGDGKLLVKFNPKGSNTSSWSKKAGWRAVVSSVEAQPWRVVGVGTSLWNEKKVGVLYPNESALLYRVTVAAEGAEGEKKLQKLTLQGENLASLARMVVYSKVKTNWKQEIDEGQSVKVAEYADFSSGEIELDFSGAPITLGNRGAEYSFFAVAASPEKISTGEVRLYVKSYTLEGSADEISVDDSGKAMPKVWETKKALYMKDGEETVSEPIEFYDAAGPKGNQEFEGTLVLRPSDPQGRVLVEFKDFSLVANTFAPENSDQMEVFSGSGADKKSLWKFDPKNGGRPNGFTAVSEANDGSLSVYFKSPKATQEGFSAEVRIVKNEPIKVRKATREVWMETGGKRPLRAGLQGSLMLLNVEGAGAQPGAAVKSIKFHVAGVALRSAKVSAYDGVNSKVADELGSVEVSGQDVEVQFTTPYELKFGKNLFAVEGVADVKSATGETATMTDVHIVMASGDELQLTPPDTKTEAKVKNVYELEYKKDKDHGDYTPRTLTVGAGWEVKNEGPSYMWGTKGGTLVLKPADAGSLVGVELKGKFDFNNSTRHDQTRFAIFSGNDTANVDKLLFEVKEQQKELPAVTKYYPQDGDTELTILFNNHGGNQGMGFTAKAWQEKEEVMKLGEVTSLQETNYLTLDGKPEAFVRLTLPVTGNRKKLELEGVKLKITQGQEYVEAVSIFTGDAEFAKATTLLAEKAQPQAEEELRFADPLKLPTGESYVWVALTIKRDAPKGSAFDLAVESLTINGTSRELGDAGNPKGMREIGNFYLFKGDDNVEVDGLIVFYDDGGPDRPFTDSKKGTVTFTAKPGNVLVLEVRALETHYQAKVKIEPKVGKAYEEVYGKSLPAKIIAGESLKVSFNPKGNSRNAFGWEMVIRSIPNDTPYEVEGAEAKSVARSIVVAGEEGVPMLRVALRVEGFASECKLEKLSVMLREEGMAASVDKVKVWATGTSEYFTDAKLLKGVACDGLRVEIPVEYAMSSVSTYYFWVGLDVAEGAAHGSEIAVQLAGVKSGAYESLPANNPWAVATVSKGIHGTFTVGGFSPNYATLTQAVAALEGGVDGPVTFLLRDGIYQEKVSIGTVPGASAKNSITIKSESGNRDAVVITSDKTERDMGIIALMGADHVTLESLTVKSSTKDVHAAVSLDKGSSYTTIRNCHLELPIPTSHNWQDGGDVVYTHSSTGEGIPTINYTTVEGCKVVGGKIGISLNGGQGGVKYSTGKGITVRNNDIESGMSKAIYITDVTEFSVEGNRVNANGKSFGYDYQGFDGRRLFGPGRIANNVIALHDGSKTLGGMCFRDDGLLGSADAPIAVVNNVITIKNAGRGGSYGISLGSTVSAGRHTVVAHNSVVIDKEGAWGSALVLGNNGEGVAVRNNLFVNLAQVGFALNAVGAETPKGIELSKNAFWSPKDGAAVKVKGEKKSLADLKKLAAYASSIVERAIVADFPNDLHLLNGKDFLLEEADAIKGIGVEKDAMGKERGAKPTVGALEYEPMPVAWYPSAPQLQQVYEDAVEVQVGLNMPGECRYVVRKKGEAEPTSAEWGSVLPIQLGMKRVLTLPMDNLVPGVEYVMYVQATAATGEELQGKVKFTTLAAGAKPAVLAAEYPKAVRNFSDAHVVEVLALRACEMKYIVVPAAALATVDYAKAVELDGGLKALEGRKLRLRDLTASTDYVLCYSTYYAGDKPTAWKQYSFKTSAPVQMKPSMGAELGTQEYNGFSLSGHAYTISGETIWSKVPGWKMDGNEATVTVNTSATGEAVRGGIVVTTGEVTLERRDAFSESVGSIQIPNTNGEARYYAFPKDIKVHEVAFSKAAGVEVELIAFGGDAAPIGLEQVGAPVIPLDGGNVKLAARVLYGGAWPVEFVWKTKDGTKLGEGLSIETDGLKAACMVDLEAKDAFGNVTMLEVQVMKQPDNLLVGGFEEKELNEKLGGSNKQWKGPEDGKLSYFSTGSFTLPMHSNKGYYSGYVVSNDESTEWDGNTELDARSAAGHGANGTKNYSVAYLPTWGGAVEPIVVQAGAEGIEVPGVYVTNTGWTYKSVLNGSGGYNGGSDKFVKGDSYKVTVTADNGKQVTVPLADYTSADASQHYALSEWAWIDLSSLGKVRTLSFSVEAKCGKSGLFPVYVAIDELGATRPERNEEKTVGANLVMFDLLQATSLDKTKSLQTSIEVEGGSLASKADGVTLTLEGTQLKVSGWDVTKGKKATETLVFRVAQLGRQEWVRLTLNYSDVPEQQKVVLASVSFDKTMGNVLVTDVSTGVEVKEGAALNLDQELSIVVVPASGYKRVATADSLVVKNAVRIGATTKWRVEGVGDVSVAAAFEKDEPAPGPQLTAVTLAAVNFDAAMGRVVVKDQGGSPLNIGDKIEPNKLIEVVAEALEGYRVKANGVQVTNAVQLQSSTRWQVSGDGDVTVTVQFEKSTAVEPVWAATLTLAPNPCSEWLRVDGVSAETLRYEVYDAVGRRVAEGVVQPVSGEVSVRDIPTGVYLLRLYDGYGESVMRRFVRR